MNYIKSEASADEQAWHQRLLAGDPVATSEVVTHFLAPLTRALMGAREQGPDTHAIESAAVDALLSYVQRPQQYQPGRGSLLAYLRMSARGDLANAEAAEHRRWSRSVSLDVEPDVAVGLADGNSAVEDDVLRRAGAGLPEGFDAVGTAALLRAEIPDPRDRRLFALMLDGERRTAIYAAVLGIEHLPPSEQRRQVKRHEDRLGKRALRLRGRIEDVSEEASGGVKS